ACARARGACNPKRRALPAVARIPRLAAGMWRGAARSAPVRGRLLSVAPVFARSYWCVLIFASDIAAATAYLEGPVAQALQRLSATLASQALLRPAPAGS